MTRTLQPSQRSCVLVGGPSIAEPAVLFSTADLLLEAPNWSLDGIALFLNGDGQLWRLDIDHPERGVQAVPFTGLPPINNDHVLDPDGVHVFLSANDGHIYRGALTGGAVERITPDDGRWHFLHGVSPDGAQLAYVEIEEFGRPSRLILLPSRGGEPVPLPAGSGHHDGPEWSPDGRWILYNTEAFTSAPGHAQLARMPAGGGAPERLTTSATVDWFPHLSPDGCWGTYLAFPPGTRGHPADLDVAVHVVSPGDWNTSVQRYPLPGGQGTLNVNGWSPDSRRFACVSYPFERLRGEG
jgi:Tol biopolymer transport system component